MSEYEGWDLRENGDIELNPMVGYATATLPDNAYAFQLRYVSRPDQPFTEPHKLQLAMSEVQLRELIQALGRMLSTPHMTAPGDEPKH